MHTPRTTDPLGLHALSQCVLGLVAMPALSGALLIEALGLNATFGSLAGGWIWLGVIFAFAWYWHSFADAPPPAPATPVPRWLRHYTLFLPTVLVSAALVIVAQVLPYGRFVSALVVYILGTLSFLVTMICATTLCAQPQWERDARGPSR